MAFGRMRGKAHSAIFLRRWNQHEVRGTGSPRPIRRKWLSIYSLLVRRNKTRTSKSEIFSTQNGILSSRNRSGYTFCRRLYSTNEIPSPYRTQMEVERDKLT